MRNLIRNRLKYRAKQGVISVHFMKQFFWVSMLMITLTGCQKENSKKSADNFFIISAEQQSNLRLQPLSDLNYVHRFWMEGGAWILHTPPDSVELFYVIGKDSTHLWVGGYSFPQRQIQIFELPGNTKELPALKYGGNLLASKKVTLIPPEHKIYLKWIFYQDGTTRLEINGVPLTARLPWNFLQANIFGYLTHNGDVRWEKQKLRGD